MVCCRMKKDIAGATTRYTEIATFEEGTHISVHSCEEHLSPYRPIYIERDIQLIFRVTISAQLVALLPFLLHAPINELKHA